MASPYDSTPAKIFIGGISPATTQESIHKYFEQFGELSDCVLMQDKSTGKSRGFGFVTYKDSKRVDSVLNQTHQIDGKPVDCKRAVPRDQHHDTPKDEATSLRTKKLFVGGLPQSLSLNAFRTYFEQFGKVEDPVIMMDKETGKSRGFGFVTFESEDSVEKVIDRYYENKIDGKWVECKKALPKDPAPNVDKKGRHRDGRDSRDRDRDRDDRDSRDRRDRSMDHHSKYGGSGGGHHGSHSYSKYSNQHAGGGYYGDHYNAPYKKSHRDHPQGHNQGGYGDYNGSGLQRYQNNMQDNYGYYSGTGYMQSPVPMQNNYDPYANLGGYNPLMHPYAAHDPSMNPAMQGMAMPMNTMHPGMQPMAGMQMGMPSMAGMNSIGGMAGMQPMNPNMGNPGMTQMGTMGTMQPGAMQGTMSQGSMGQPSNVQGNLSSPNLQSNSSGMQNANMPQSPNGTLQSNSNATNANTTMNPLPMGANSIYGQNMTSTYGYPDTMSYGTNQRGNTGYTMNPYEGQAGPIKSKFGKGREDRAYKPYPYGN